MVANRTKNVSVKNTFLIPSPLVKRLSHKAAHCLHYVCSFQAFTRRTYARGLADGRRRKSPAYRWRHPCAFRRWHRRARRAEELANIFFSKLIQNPTDEFGHIERVRRAGLSEYGQRLHG